MLKMLGSAVSFKSDLSTNIKQLRPQLLERAALIGLKGRQTAQCLKRMTHSGTNERCISHRGVTNPGRDRSPSLGLRETPTVRTMVGVEFLTCNLTFDLPVKSVVAHSLAFVCLEGLEHLTGRLAN